MCNVQLGFSPMMVLLVGFRSYFKASLTELGLLGAKCPKQYEICGSESSRSLQWIRFNSFRNM